MTAMKPSIGRIVHYVAYGTPGGEYPAGAHRAAIVVSVPPPPSPDPRCEQSASVGLCILNPTGMFFCSANQDEETKAPGTWHWPERE